MTIQIADWIDNRTEERNAVYDFPQVPQRFQRFRAALRDGLWPVSGTAAKSGGPALWLVSSGVVAGLLTEPQSATEGLPSLRMTLS
jgi:hypothetical protein